MAGASSQTAALFSPSGDSFALPGADGIIRIYDTGTGRLKVPLKTSSSKPEKDGSLPQPNGHLVERHTCTIWAVSGRKKKKTSTWSEMLLVGTASGDVKAYDTKLGEMKWRATGCIEGGVLALSHSQQKPGVLLAAGASGQLVSLSMENGEVQETFQASKHSISCLAVSPDAQHAYGGGSTLALWDLSTQQRVAKYTGHTVPATCAVFTPDASAVATCCPSERHVAVWTIPQLSTETSQETETPNRKASKGKGLQPAAAALSLEHPAIQLVTCSLQGENEPVSNGNGPSNSHASSHGWCLAAVSDNGEAYVWQCGPESTSQTDGKLQPALLARIKIQEGSDSSLQDRILGARLLPGSKGPSLLIARGSTAKPVFETITLPSQPPKTPSAATITLQPLAEGVLLPSGTAATTKATSKDKPEGPKRTAADVSVLGPGSDMGGMPIALRTAAPATVPDQGTQQNEQPSEQQDMQQEDEEDAPPEELQPLGERVAAMQAAAGTGQPQSDQQAAGLPTPQGSDKANSLAVLLTQALRSNDRMLLERCLSNTSSIVIANTIARLLPVDAAAFLRAAVDRLLSSPARAGQLAPWVKAVLHHHTGYIMSAPAAQAPLAALYQAIDARVSSYQQLLRLHGRLNLVLAHSRAAQRVAQATGQTEVAGVGAIEPEVVYQDDEEDVEVEDPFAVDFEAEGSDDDVDGDGDEEAGFSDEGLSDDDLGGDDDEDMEDDM